MLAGATRSRLAHGLRDGREVELAWVVLEADGHARHDEVHGRVVEGSGRRRAQFHLEAGGGQRGLQVRGELPVGAAAVVDEEARAFNVANGRRSLAAARPGGRRRDEPLPPRRTRKTTS